MTSDLATTQRRLWRLLTAPSGVRAALEEAGDPQAASLRDFVLGDARGSAALRLEVYANAYFYRIHDALAEDYGALRAALPPEGFHDLVTAYLLVHPPERPSLRDAGARLPRFLAEAPEAAPFRRRWPFASDLARLEWALVDAFDAPEAAPLSAPELAALPPERWESLVLPLHPSAALLRLQHPVHRLREAFEAGGELPAPPGPEPATALVWRRAERVLLRALAPLESELLERASRGAPFGALCQWLAEREGEAEAPGRAAFLLAAWVEAGLIARSP